MPDRKQIHQTIHLYGCVLLAFALPACINLAPLLIVLLLLNWVAEGNLKEKMIAFSKNKISLLFVSFYLLYVIGLLWTQNMGSGRFDLEVKLSILLFPILFSSSSLQNKSFSKVLYGFILGCTAASFYCIGLACYTYMEQGKNHFTYILFSNLLHPSYFAMYLNLALVFLIYLYYLHTPSFLSKIIYICLALLFILTILLCSSKMGIATLALFMLGSILYFIFIKKKWLIGLSLLLGATIITFVVYTYSHSIRARIENAVYVATHPNNYKSDAIGSNTERIEVWKSCASVLRNEYLTGVGTGDVNDALHKVYVDENRQDVLSKNLNPHNQYLQTSIALGIAGLVLLLCQWMVPLLTLSKNERLLYGAFIFLFAFNCLVESMLEVQAGVIFYGFFNSLLFFNRTNIPLLPLKRPLTNRTPLINS
jgi:O-antigen ligase